MHERPEARTLTQPGLFPFSRPPGSSWVPGGTLHICNVQSVRLGCEGPRTGEIGVTRFSKPFFLGYCTDFFCL